MSYPFAMKVLEGYMVRDLFEKLELLVQQIDNELADLKRTAEDANIGMEQLELELKEINKRLDTYEIPDLME